MLIDVDHLPDYIFFRRGWRGLTDFFDACDQRLLRRVFLWLHSWDLLIVTGLGLALAGNTPGASWLFMVWLGFAYHLAFDQFGNRSKAGLFYFLCFRALKGFRGAALLGPPA